MSWNYRIIDHDTHLALHEVHYDRRGRVSHWSARPTTFVAGIEEGADGLAQSLAMALDDARRRPVLPLASLPRG